MLDLRQDLIKKIKIFNETIWENRADQPKIEKWLDNFEEDRAASTSERIHALYLLSQFMFFGDRQMRELLKALYRDLYKYRIVERIRKINGDTTDIKLIHKLYDQELESTRFLGVGNPSESGTHLLYYFRQENSLPKKLFIHGHEIFTRFGSPMSVSLHYPAVKRYVFIDDFCGSGQQASEYSERIVQDIKNINNNIEVAYYMLFATKSGIKKIRDETLFDLVETVFELDDTYKCFSKESRYFSRSDKLIDKTFAKEMCQKYGKTLLPSDPLGYRNCQLLIGFHHNTPDNTLPIIWFDETGGPKWVPIFKRYPKIYK